MSGIAILAPDDHGSTVGASNILHIKPGQQVYGAIEEGRNGTTIPDRDYDWYKVSLDAGTSYFLKSLTVDSNALSSALYQVRDSAGQIVSFFTSQSMERPNGQGGDVFTVETSGDYFLSVYSSCCVCTGYYGFEVATAIDDFGGGNKTDGVIAVGTTRNTATGVIGANGDRDSFKVDLVAGQTYVFTADAKIDGTNGTLSDPVLRLRDADGALLVFNNDTSVGGESSKSGASRVTNSSLIQYTAATTGSFYIEVGANQKEMGGAYTVGVQAITMDSDYNHSDPRAWHARPGGSSARGLGVLSVNAPVTEGVIEHAGDRDWYGVELDADVTYMLRVQRTTLGSGIDDAVIRLFDTRDNGYQFITFNNTAANDPLGRSGPTDALILYKPSVAGIYFIEASDAANATGGYHISVSVLDDAAGSTDTIQKVLVNERSVSGHIEVTGDSDWYSVYLTEGVTYTLEARQAARNPLSDPFLNLRNASGQVIASDDDGDGANARLVYTAQSSGLFYLDVQDKGSGTGRYTVKASAYDDSANGLTLLSLDVDGGTANGSINYGGDTDVFMVELAAGTTYTLRMQGLQSGLGLTLTDPRMLGLYDTDGVLIRNTANDDHGNSRDARVEYTATRDGYYFLWVAGSSVDDVGSYRLSLAAQTLVDVTEGVGTRNQIAVGGSVASVLATSTDKDWFRVDLIQGQRYVVELASDTTSSQPLFDPKIGGLYDASGSLISGTTQDNYGQTLNSRLVFTATDSGTHYLEAAASAGPVGAYRLSIRELSQTVDSVGHSLQSHARIELTEGQGAVDGSVDMAGDIDWYGVNLLAGQRYEITIRGAASGMGSLLDPRLQGIHDAGGHLIIGTPTGTGEGGADVRTWFTPHYSGSFYVAAAGTGGGAGSYRVEVSETAASDDVQGNALTTASVMVGNAFLSQIDELGDTDWVKVSFDAYSTATLTLTGVGGSMGRLDRPHIGSVFTERGEAIHLDRTATTQPDRASVVQFTTSQAGTYYVQVESQGGSIGGYQLKAAQTALVNLSPELMDAFIDHDPTTLTRVAGLIPVDGMLTLHFGKPVAGVFGVSIEGVGTPSYYAKQPIDMLKGSGKIYISGNGQQLEIDVNSEQVVVSGNTVTIKPNVPFLPDTDYGVIIDPGTFVDVTGAAFQGIGVPRETIYQDKPEGEQLITAMIHTLRPEIFADTVKKQITNELFFDPDEFIFRTAAASTSAGKAAWTLMVYMAADNELEGSALESLREMIGARYGDEVRVHVLIDRAAGYDASGANWTDAYQGMLSGDVTVDNIPQKWTSLGEVNTGDPSVLANFIATARAASPADRYGLVVWGPGGGLSGTAWDDSAAMDALSLPELSGALATAGLVNTWSHHSSDDLTSPLRVIDAGLAKDGMAIRLGFNYWMWDPTIQLVPYNLVDYSPAFQYSLDGGASWQQVGSMSIGADGVLLGLGSPVAQGTSVMVRYNADQRFTYFDASANATRTTTWGALLLADNSYFSATNTSVDDYFNNGFPRSSVVSAQSFEITITDDRLDLLSFDSSQMGLLETLTQMAPFTHTLVAGPGEISADGLDYGQLLDRLGSAYTLNGSQLASEMVNNYRAKHAGTHAGALGAFALDGSHPETWIPVSRGVVTFPFYADFLKDIAANLSALAEYMLEEATPGEWDFMRTAVMHTISQPSGDGSSDYYRDLGDFLQYLFVNDPRNIPNTAGTGWANHGPIASYARDAKLGLTFMTLEASRADSDSQALGIYLPNATAVSSFYDPAGLDFLKLTFPAYSFQTQQWDEFIAVLQAGLGNTAPYDLSFTATDALTLQGSNGPTLQLGLPELVGSGNRARLAEDLLLGTVSFTDDDAFQAGNRLALSGTDSGLFRLVGDSLFLRAGVQLDYESRLRFDVTLTVTDAYLDATGANHIKNLVINLINQDESLPSFAADAISLSVDENTPASTVVHTAQATDGSDPGTLRYSLKPVGDHGSFTVNDSTGELLFKTAPDYEARNLYSVTILATDPVGQRAEQTVTINVIDQADGGTDERAPVVRTFSPADDATRVSLNPTIVLSFDEPIKAGDGDIVVRTLNGTEVERVAIGDAGRVTIDGRILSIDLAAQLANNTTYVVTVGAGVVTDLADNPVAAITDYNFKTLRGIAGVTTAANDTQAPTATYDPADGASNVAVDQSIVLTFSEAIQRNAGTISLVQYSADGQSVPRVVETFDVASSSRLTIVNSGGTHTLTVDPTGVLATSSRYGLIVASGAVVDAAGNAYVDAGSYDFTTAAKGSFDIDLVFIDDENTVWSGFLKDLVRQAADQWEQVIVGDLPDHEGVDDLVISVENAVLDAGSLGYGGFSGLRPGDLTGLPHRGEIVIDLTKAEDMGALKALVVHEIGHVLGFGTLWDMKGLNSIYGQYNGETALDVYRQMSDNPDVLFVPLETGGGKGTANVHWSEALFGTEIMTGYQGSQPDQMSALTVAALADLGYQVDYSAADLDYMMAGQTLAPLIDLSSLGTTQAAMQAGVFIV